MLPLDIGWHQLVGLPAQPVTGNLVPELTERGHRLRVALQRRRHREDGQGQTAALEDPQDPPETGP
ncbi:Uncharacterised protein [Mycobacteroides abscessus subsp. abscessus]|nr:Uncharacterised protein [Mycobacteroides abscessus subsp. abscessus]